MKTKIKIKVFFSLILLVTITVFGCKKNKITVDETPILTIISPRQDKNTVPNWKITKVYIGAQNLYGRFYHIEFKLKGKGYENDSVIYTRQVSEDVDMANTTSHDGSRNTFIYVITDIAKYDVYYIKLLDTKIQEIPQNDTW